MKKVFQHITIFAFTLFFTINVVTAQTPQDVANKALHSTVVLTMDNGNKGSGFFVAPDLIVTLYSVIKGASSGYAHEKNYPIVGIAAAMEYSDLVILKVSGVHGKSLSIGDSDLVKKGDRISIFHPNKNPAISILTITTTIHEIRKSQFINEFLINARASSGLGGEPVLNNEGEVIGIFKRTDPDEDNFKQNIKTVIASENLNQLIDTMRTKESQKFPRPLSADGVTGTHLTWGPDYYELTLWNHRDETLFYPQYVVIFKDEKGEVICADPVEWGGIMFAGCGKRVSRNFFSNPKPGHFKGYFYDPASKPDSPGDSFIVSLVGPSVKQIMHNYEVRVIDLRIDTRFPSQKESLKGFTGNGLTWFELSKYPQVDGIEEHVVSIIKGEDSPKEVGFSYSVQNNLSTDITNVRLTLVFYDKEGVPIDQWAINNAVNILAKQTLKVKGSVSRSTKQLTKSVEPRIVPFPFKTMLPPRKF